MVDPFEWSEADFIGSVAPKTAKEAKEFAKNDVPVAPGALANVGEFFGGIAPTVILAILAEGSETSEGTPLTPMVFAIQGGVSGSGKARLRARENHASGTDELKAAVGQGLVDAAAGYGEGKTLDSGMGLFAKSATGGLISGGQTLGENFVARHSDEPDRPLGQDVAKQTIIGAATTFIASVAGMVTKKVKAIYNGEESVQVPSRTAKSRNLLTRLKNWWNTGAAETEAKSLVTSHPEAHSFERHGGSVTDSQLETRARTGVAPDGSVKTKPNGSAILPPTSSAFYSDELLLKADQAVRAGPLEAQIRADPTKTIQKVEKFDVGFDAGRGYSRIGKASESNLQGPLQRLDKLRKVTAIYEKNATTGKWETITIYPEP